LAAYQLPWQASYSEANIMIRRLGMIGVVGGALYVCGCETNINTPPASTPPGETSRVDVDIQPAPAPGPKVDVNIDRPGAKVDVNIDRKPGGGVDVDVKRNP
jgi:hypothetical protein